VFIVPPLTIDAPATIRFVAEILPVWVIVPAFKVNPLVVRVPLSKVAGPVKATELTVLLPARARLPPLKLTFMDVIDSDPVIPTVPPDTVKEGVAKFVVIVRLPLLTVTVVAVRSAGNVIIPPDITRFST
jgi:hypothetical protein